MLKQLRRSDLSGVSLWQEHWKQFDEIRFDADSIRWDGFLDIVNARVSQGPILEAGCGLGRYLLYLRARGARAAGVDFAPEPLQAIQRRVGPAPVAVADLARLPFPSGTFSTILCLGVIEHFESGPEPIVRELVQALRPGGVLILTVPYANAPKKWRAWRRGSNVVRASDATPPGWTFYQFCYAPRELRQVIERAGLSVVAERRIGRLFSLAGWLQSWRGRQPGPKGRASAPGHGPAPPAGGTGNGSAGRFMRMVKQTALWAEPLLPAPLLAHMALAVGYKPLSPTPGKEHDAAQD